jgi:succinylarginine dihydrolase
MTNKANEYNFDGLIGPTHNFSGLAFGNLASQKSAHQISHPKKAALQGLEKMKLLLDLGVPQGFIPPQERPSIRALRNNGYTGRDDQILKKAAKNDFNLLLSCSSSSSMWTANAATVSPSCDTEDGRLHISPANLATLKHRSIEPPDTIRFLKAIFKDSNLFSCHQALPVNGTYFDEGAANHMRFSEAHGLRGVEVFAFGKSHRTERDVPKKYPARQSLEASKRISHRHGLLLKRAIFAKQNPNAIDLGVFHNDVIALSNERVLLCHELAFIDTEGMFRELEVKFSNVSNKSLSLVQIKEEDLGVEEAVQSYLFNSQLVTLPTGRMALICPSECLDKRVKRVIDSAVSETSSIDQVHFVDLRESMMNGGGPACLRLRVVLTQKEAEAVTPGYILNKERFAILHEWVSTHYREELHLNDLKDPKLLKESRDSLDVLTQLLGLGNIYSFQK